MWDHDLRFLSIAREDIEDLTLQDVKEAVMAQMTTDSTEVRLVDVGGYEACARGTPPRNETALTSPRNANRPINRQTDTDLHRGGL